MADSKYFHADAERGRRNGKKPFTIAHAAKYYRTASYGTCADNTMQDILIRWQENAGL